MASTINAITTGAGGIVTTGDSTGQIGLQNNGTTIATTSSTGLTINVGGLNLLAWTTGTRPGSPVTGTTGYNTTTGQIEVYNATYSTWTNAGTSGITYSASYVIVAGGGAGGYSNSGGGGAGGYLTGTTLLNSGVTYTITIGGGGTTASPGGSGNNGTNSTLTGITSAVGGGGGGGIALAGLSGGSGGGGGGMNVYDPTNRRKPLQF